MDFLAFDPRKGKKVLVGELVGDTLFRDVEARHYMRVLDGYGIQEPAFQELVEKNIKYIVIKVKSTRDCYKANIDDWKIKGRVAEYGHGKQRFLSLKYMKRYTPKVEYEYTIIDY